MASSTLSTDRRWASSSRKSGMTVLGKVPKPINLPSQRLENNGLDPNVEIVPKGTITWGTTRPTSSPSPNAWSTNTSTLLSPKPGSPCTEPGRPVSSGSRPSTGSDRTDSLSDLRPNSSSGVLAMGQLAVLSGQNRPRSADTRPGSGHLSRFAESVEKGVTSNEAGFTLGTGDFPTLGTEKPSESQRGHSSQGRPTSREAKPKEILDAPLSGHNLPTRPMSGSRTDSRPKTPNTGDYSDPRTLTQTTQNVNILKTEDHSNSWYQPAHPYQSRPNLNPHVPAPLQYDSSWRASPPQEPTWYGSTGPHGPGPQGPIPAGLHGPGPRGPAGLHGPSPHGPGPQQYRPAGAYQVEPFVYYQPSPPHQFRGPAPNSAESAATRPHLIQHPYLIQPAGPGIHAPPHTAYGPGSYDAGYYGPPRTGFYGNPSHHHQSHNAPHQNTTHHHNNSHNYNSNYNKNNNTNNQQQQQGILSQYSERPVSSSSVDSVGPKQYKVLLKHREKKEDEKKDEIVPPAVKTESQSSETKSEKQDESGSQKKKDPLIQKIEGLNSKMRNMNLVNKEVVKKKQTGEGILATPGGSSPVRTGEFVERRANNEQRKAETDVEKIENVGTVSEANLDLLDPAEYEIQRLKQKEKAAQRARELQMEEEERIRQQRAKALAKLEELNRRANLQKDPSNSSNDKQEESPKVSNDYTIMQREPSKISNDANMPKEQSKVSNEANVQKEPQIARKDKQELTKVIADSHLPKEPPKVANDVPLQKEPRKFANDNKHLQKEPRKFPNEKHHHQRERQKAVDDRNLQKEPSKSTNEKQPQQDLLKSTTDKNSQKEPFKFPNEIETPQNTTVASSVPTTVTFGTFSGVPISSHEISLPTIVGMVQEPVPVSSQSKPQSHKNQTVYKKKHNTSNDSSETSTNEKSINSVAGVEPLNESQHKKRSNKNPRNKNKPDETVPVEERVEKSSEESKPAKNPTPKPTENPNPKQPHENPNFHNNNRVGGNWKPQASRRPVRNPRNVPDKSHSGENVMWAPVKQSNKTNQSEESSNQNIGTVYNQIETETQTVNNNASGKTKRAEMERYVPKPQLEKKLDEPTGEVLSSVEPKIGEGSDNNNKSFRRGNKPNPSWRQRAVVPVDQVPVQEENRNTNTEPIQDANDLEGNRKRNNNSSHKFYTATGNNYSGQGNSSNSGGSDVNMNEAGGEQTQRWKPNFQNKDTNWQKVGDNINNEGVAVNPIHKGNEKFNNRGFEEQKETNWGGTGDVELEGRPSRSYRGRGRGRNGNYARE